MEEYELFKYIPGFFQSQLMLDREKPIRGKLDNINHFIFQDACQKKRNGCHHKG